MLIYAFAAIVAAALGAFGIVWAYQRYAIYTVPETYVTPAEAGFDAVREVRFPTESGGEAHAWVIDPGPGHPVILAFQGNGARTATSMERLMLLVEDGAGVAMLRYRGFEGLPGEPSELGFAEDARALYDALDDVMGQDVPPERRVLYGFSLGAGVGSRLAASRDFAGVILQGASDRTCRYYTRHLRGFPMCRLMWRERYDLVDHVVNAEAPVLVVHGTYDATVRTEEARALYDAAPNGHAFVELPGGHVDLDRHGLDDVLRDFVETVAPAPN
ncbi:hypothetical protein HKCCE2091_10435 [Rhodobacterales bacterium HKCCE2091]|nr:hypothetical protein [Rhodobacterales bacterium HKCCE2091]